jgi:hypothetical protein
MSEKVCLSVKLSIDATCDLYDGDDDVDTNEMRVSVSQNEISRWVCQWYDTKQM